MKRAQSLIPTPYDTKQEAERKIKMLDEFFSGIEQRAYSVATGTPDSLKLKGGGGGGGGWSDTTTFPGYSQQ